MSSSLQARIHGPLEKLRCAKKGTTKKVSRHLPIARAWLAGVRRTIV